MLSWHHDTGSGCGAAVIPPPFVDNVGNTNMTSNQHMQVCGVVLARARALVSGDDIGPLDTLTNQRLMKCAQTVKLFPRSGF